MSLDSKVLPSLNPQVYVEINADGERGDPVPSVQEGLYRVLVAGGSAAECGLLTQAATWPARLQALLNKPAALAALGARRAHVGNIGRSMMPCEAVLAMLERTLPRYEKLDTLVLMVGVSDLLDWLERGMPAVIAEGQISTGEIFGEHPEQKFSWSPNGLASKRTIAWLMRRFGGKVYRRKNAGSRLAEFRKRRENANLLVDHLADATPVLNHFEAYLRRIVALAQSKGIQVILVRQPWLDRELTADEQKLTWNFCASRLTYDKIAAAYYSLSAVRSLLHACDRRTARIASSLGIRQVDLRASVPGSLDNFYDELHFTEAGARLVAEAVAPALTGLDFGPAPSTVDEAAPPVAAKGVLAGNNY